MVDLTNDDCPPGNGSEEPLSNNDYPHFPNDEPSEEPSSKWSTMSTVCDLILYYWYYKLKQYSLHTKLRLERMAAENKPSEELEGRYVIDIYFKSGYQKVQHN